jgi:sterol desaturase/sphingolipid hydroxylase (fatty acid hydroxylase superfamily)
MFDVIVPLIETWPAPLKMSFIALVITLLILLRYFVFTTAAYGVSRLIGWLSPWRRLQATPFTSAQIKREIGYSMLSVITFTGVVGVIVLMSQAGWTRIYSDANQYGMLWFWLQIPVALLIQDLYFYWMHRISHTPGMYERVHKAHHLSTNPSAFAAFAFHPLEAILEIGIFLVIVVLIPMHAGALLMVGLFSLAYNVYGHLGYEIMPRFIAKSPLGYLLNKSAYHNQHHRTFRYNYGLYTVIWDRLHGTLHPKADQLYDKVTIRNSQDGLGVAQHVNTD